MHKKEKALVFSSGYVANESTISSLLNVFENCVVFSDEKNHASIISGIRKSNAQKFVYKHNDMFDLENKLKLVNFDQPKLIVFESVCSMDGSIGNLKVLLS